MSKPREFWIQQAYRGEHSGTAYPASIHTAPTEGYIHVREVVDEAPSQSAEDAAENHERSHDFSDCKTAAKDLVEEIDDACKASFLAGVEWARHNNKPAR